MFLKRAIPAILLILTCALPCRAQDDFPLKFTETEWEFGTIREDGGVVSHKFSFRNTGETPIAIDRVNSSCGCTTPDYPRSLIQPESEASVTVSFDPMGYPGPFSKSVVVVSGGGKYHDLLIIRGEVTPRMKTVDEEYPLDLGGGLRVDNATLAFRQVAQGKVSSMAVKYVNTSDGSVSLEMIPVEASGLLEVSFPETVCAGCKGEMTFTYNLTDKEGHYGMIHDLVRFAVNGTGKERGIYATMIGVDDFSAQSIEVAPKMSLSSQFHNYGEVRARRMPYVYRMTLRNDGEETLHIRSVSEKPGVKATIRGGMSLAPGASLPFELLLYSDKYNPGELFESIIITANDPLRPIREIRISAKIK